MTGRGLDRGLSAADGQGPLPVRLRRPAETDHPAIVAVIDEWWGGRRMRASLPRLWFRDFATWGWIAETEEGRAAGFLTGFGSVDRSDVAVIHLVGVDPNVRRRDVGRRLVERFAEDARDRGRSRLEIAVPPDDPVALAFLRALGFRPLDGDGAVRLWGTPAFEDHDGPGADRAVLVREA